MQNDNLRKLLIEHEEHKPNKEYTVKISLPKEGKPYFRDEVLDFISQKISLDKLVALGPLNQNNIWLATFSDADSAALCLGSKLSSEGNQLGISSMCNELVTVRIHWLPSFVSMAHVVAYMSSFGVVKNLSWDYSNIKKFDYVKTSVRNIVIELDEGVEVPSLDKLFYEGQSYPILLTVPGRGSNLFLNARKLDI